MSLTSILRISVQAEARGHKFLFQIICFFLFFISSLDASIDESEALSTLPALKTPSAEHGVTIDLREPSYCDGILSTDMGGVISAPNIRIQATQLRYTRKILGPKESAEQSIWSVEGEGNLIIEFGEYVFVGEKLIYDFLTKEGTIYYGKTAV